MLVLSLSRFLLLLAATHSDPSGRGGHTSANQLGSWAMPKVDERMYNVSWHLSLDFMVVIFRLANLEEGVPKLISADAAILGI